MPWSFLAFPPIVSFLMACFKSGTNAAATLIDRIPACNNFSIASARPASSPQMDTGVSFASLTTNSMRRKTVGWSSMKYASFDLHSLKSCFGVVGYDQAMMLSWQVFAQIGKRHTRLTVFRPCSPINGILWKRFLD